MRLIKKIIHKCLNKYGYQIIEKKIDQEYNTRIYNNLFSNDSLENKRFYNIGAGGFYHPFWTNIDFYNDWYKEYASNIGIHYDLMKCLPLPINSDSAEVIYTSHTIEHITDEAIINMFREVYRILKSGGCFRITAPDVNLWYRAFKENDRDFFADSIEYYSNENVMNELDINSMKEASIGAIFQYYFSATTSPITKYSSKKKFIDEELKVVFSEMQYRDALTYICSFCHFDPKKSGYHINWVNAEKTVDILRKVGFSNVFISAYGQSFNPVLRDINLFDNTVPEWSFYVEAYK